jgi:preprotein translocase subunit SecE
MAAITKGDKLGNDGKKLMADEDLPGDVEEADEPGDEREPERGAAGQRPSQPKPVPAGQGFFTIRKKGHGYWTRMGTAIGAGFLGVMVAFELYRQIPTFLPGADEKRNHRIAIVISLVFLTAYSLWAFWFTNRPTTVDFLVATDSEMKKVNWTTRAELIGSTKIVIVFMFLIAMYLFSCDLLFGGFFKLIGVLKTMF